MSCCSQAGSTVEYPCLGGCTFAWFVLENGWILPKLVLVFYTCLTISYSKMANQSMKNNQLPHSCQYFIYRPCPNFSYCTYLFHTTGSKLWDLRINLIYEPPIWNKTGAWNMKSMDLVIAKSSLMSWRYVLSIPVVDFRYSLSILPVLNDIPSHHWCKCSISVLIPWINPVYMHKPFRLLG